LRRVPAACLVVAGLFLAALSAPPEADSLVRRTFPRPGAVLPTPPLLRWRAVSSAHLYNVQLYREGRKILSRWPTRARYQLRRTWTYKGHRFRLRPAVYRWYVWPWLGSSYGRIRVSNYFIRGIAPANTSPPILTGDAREGAALAASRGTWTGTRPIRVSYRWQRCDPAGKACTDIALANTAGYQPTSADIGKKIRVVVAATNLAGSRSVASAVTAVVTPAPPLRVSRPAIWGPLQQGEILTATNGAWTSSAPVSYSFAWQRCNRAGTRCRTIRGATSQAYRLRAAEFERRVRVVVTAANAGGSRSASSAVSPVVGRVFLGTSGADAIVGSLGADRMRARGGDDYVHGSYGNDRLRGGPGSDRLFGGSGRDTIVSRDDWPDWVNCGGGRDRVVADRFDHVSRCETVVRR
jgi:hypothetical protein